MPNEENNIPSLEDTTSKSELLEKLSTLVHLDTGRKKRSDKGKEHAKPTTPREQTKLGIYNRVKSRVDNRNQELLKDGTTTLQKEFDENGFYLPIPESYTSVGKTYEQLVNGRKITHNVRRIRTQKYIDLEEYRYNAWRELALEPSTKYNIVEPSADLRGILITRYNIPYKEVDNIIVKRAINWQTLFEEIYFVKQEDIPYFDYDTWREHYDCIPSGTILNDDFRFDRYNKPGSEKFCPEFKDYVDKHNKLKEEDLQNEAQRKSSQYISNMRRS